MKTVNAADFGWDRQDAYDCLRKALDSDADVVKLTYMGPPWKLSRPLEIRRGDLTIEAELSFDAKKDGD